MNPSNTKTPTERTTAIDLVRRATAAENTGLTLTQDFQQFIGGLSAAHLYSPTNNVLIYLERPNATRCASYAYWKENGRQVKKGEHGIKILVPLWKKGKDGKTLTEEQKGKEAPTYYRVGHVFDVSQTEEATPRG